MQRFEIVSLRGQTPARRKELVHRFDREIYRAAFPNADQREDPQQWLETLARNPDSPAPYLTILLALSAQEQIGGGLVLEHYREAETALVTYLAVPPRFRGYGTSRLLLDHALELLQWSQGRKPIPLLAEMENPLLSPPEEAASAFERAAILNALGLVKCDLPYVQPALSRNGGRVRDMLLCAQRRTLRNDRLSSARLKAFLHEFYRSLDVAEPELDQDWQAMAEWLSQREEVVFSPLPTGGVAHGEAFG